MRTLIMLTTVLLAACTTSPRYIAERIPDPVAERACYENLMPLDLLGVRDKAHRDIDRWIRLRDECLARAYTVRLVPVTDEGLAWANGLSAFGSAIHSDTPPPGLSYGPDGLLRADTPSNAFFDRHRPHQITIPQTGQSIQYYQDY